jgi:hypothetical protein
MKTRVIAAIAAAIVVLALGSAILLSSASGSTPTSTRPASTTVVPCDQKAYAGGETYCFTVVRGNVNASQVQLDSAQVMYVVTYPQLNSLCSGNVSSCKPASLPSGYSPQCDPCIQEAPSVYHDHIFSVLPSSGTGSFRIVVVAYAPSFSSKAGFTPMNSASAITAGEAAGDFVKINPTGANPYEMPTKTVLTIIITPTS